MDLKKDLGPTSVRKEHEMMPTLYDVRPTALSQTTSDFEEVIDTQSNNLGFFDIQAPVIESVNDQWNTVAHQVLTEHADLWEKLAEL
jgi:hypothetical protein